MIGASLSRESIAGWQARGHCPVSVCFAKFRYVLGRGARNRARTVRIGRRGRLPFTVVSLCDARQLLSGACLLASCHPIVHPTTVARHEAYWACKLWQGSTASRSCLPHRRYSLSSSGRQQRILALGSDMLDFGTLADLKAGRCSLALCRVRCWRIDAVAILQRCSPALCCTAANGSHAQKLCSCSWGQHSKSFQVSSAECTVAFDAFQTRIASAS